MDSVDNTAKRPEDMTVAEIRATLAEAAVLSKKNEIEIEKFRESIAESSREFNTRMDRMAEEREKAAKERAEEEAKWAKEREKEAKEREKEAKEREKSYAELHKAIFGVNEEREKEAKEREKSYAELHKAIFGVNEEREKEAKEREKSYAKLHDLIYGVNSEVKGIAKSNNMMSEGYLFKSLDATKMMGGVHFDIVAENMRATLKRKDGTKVEGQYDVVMMNDTAVCIVEVKYRLRRDDVYEVVDKHVNTFKELFPRYEGYKFYLAVGGMAIEDDAITTAKDLGVAVIRTKGGALEILDDNLKAY